MLRAGVVVQRAAREGGHRDDRRGFTPRPRVARRRDQGKAHSRAPERRDSRVGPGSEPFRRGARGSRQRQG